MTELLVGTRKGLWVGQSDASRQSWSWSGPHFDMMEIYSCLVDRRGGRDRLLVSAASPWTGPQVFESTDLGESWQELSPVTLAALTKSRRRSDSAWARKTRAFHAQPAAESTMMVELGAGRRYEPSTIASGRPGITRKTLVPSDIT